MEKQDYIVEAVHWFLEANKSREYQDRIIRGASTLYKFMKDNQLFVDVDPFDEDGNLKLDFEFYASNLTEEGDIFYDKVVIPWYRYLDRSTQENKYDTTAWLEKKWAKVKSEQ